VASEEIGGARCGRNVLGTGSSILADEDTNMVRLRTCLVVILFVMAASPLAAATFIVPSDRELVKGAEAVVIATPERAWSFFGGDGLIHTTTALHLDDLLYGAIPDRGSIEVTLPGGVIGDLINVVTGSPALASGRQYILFLRRDGGTWSVKGHALGAFEILPAPDGLRAAIRGEQEGIAGWDQHGTTWREPLRDAARFIDFIRSGGEGEGQYLLESQDQRGIGASGMEPLSHYKASAYCAKPQGLPFRRPEFDSGGSTGFLVNGTHPGFADTPASVNRSMEAWNTAPAATIKLANLGTTTADSGVYDGTNTIRLGGSLGNNLAGRAILWSLSSRTHWYEGETFLDIIESDIVIDSSYGETVAEEILAHELGHCVGFRHSDSGTPGSGNAVMTSALSILRPVLGANLQEWDRDAASHVYGPVTCSAPAITSQPQSQTISKPGLFASLDVVVTGTAPIAYQWYEGTTGDVSKPVGGNSSSYGDVFWVTTNLWVRASNACGSASSTTATITVEAACISPSISAQPASQSISSGGSAMLSVTASGTAPLTYQWYRGATGNTSQPVGTNSSSYNTGALAATTSYWVRVTNSCGTVSSTTAVITVEASCSPPVITTQPRSQTITVGEATLVAVAVNGSNPMSYQWYRGVSGDLTHPLSGGTSALDTGPLTVTTSFWVRVSNDCGSADSTTAVITVVEACTLPVIMEQPQSRTVAPGGSTTLQVTAGGTGPLLFRWYRGARGDTTQPVGTNSNSLVTGPLAETTNFWVRVSNSCGTADSNTVTVTVTEACSLTVVGQPLSQTIRAGGQATLSVEVMSAGGGDVVYQWFAGASGDTSTPLTQLNGSSVETGSLAATMTFWVRVTNGCATVDSETAIITVFTPRTRAVRSG
jgi:hypothetical protein